ncbi:MAG: endolytic transglycosylase MltG [Chitinophagales bacterium]
MKKLFLIAVALGLVSFAGCWVIFFQNNIKDQNKRAVLNIPTGSDFDDVLKLMQKAGLLSNENTFRLVAQWKNYPANVKPGHYVFNKTMSNREMVNMLKSGNQVPVKLVIYNIRTKEEFAGLVGRTMELDSVFLLSKLNDAAFCSELGRNTNTILSAFVTDNYEFKWNASFEEFLAVMKKAYDRFWNNERMAKAVKLGYQPSEIVTLASIVEKECIFDKELPTVAGVYLNRLKCNMPLQADPTLVFALRDFDARRVWNYHKEYDSPYNTYMYAGLPPGPICMPRKKSIDAVLNFQDHDYLYFCANPDMSGYSIFSKTLDEQNKVARMYREKVTEMGVH